MGSGHSSGSVKATYEPCRVEPEVRWCKGSINGSFGLCGLNEIERVTCYLVSGYTSGQRMVSIKEAQQKRGGPISRGNIRGGHRISERAWNH